MTRGLGLREGGRRGGRGEGCLTREGRKDGGLRGIMAKGRGGGRLGDWLGGGRMGRGI